MAVGWLYGSGVLGVEGWQLADGSWQCGVERNNEQGTRNEE